MATKQDLELLESKIGGLESKVDLTLADTTALKNELKALNENANIDLGPVIARVEKMEARLSDNAGPNVGSDPEAPPVEPPVEG